MIQQTKTDTFSGYEGFTSFCLPGSGFLKYPKYRDIQRSPFLITHIKHLGYMVINGGSQHSLNLKNQLRECLEGSADFLSVLL